MSQRVHSVRDDRVFSTIRARAPLCIYKCITKADSLSFAAAEEIKIQRVSLGG